MVQNGFPQNKFNGMTYIPGSTCFLLYLKVERKKHQAIKKNSFGASRNIKDVFKCVIL